MLTLSYCKFESLSFLCKSQICDHFGLIFWSVNPCMFQDLVTAALLTTHMIVMPAQVVELQVISGPAHDLVHDPMQTFSAF